LCVDSLQNGGKLLLFGNGGSAADAQHLSAELTIRFVRHRRALAAIALTTDTSALTACANDYGFETVFARQIEALGRPGDVAIGFSTSGQSPNIIRALEAARKTGIAAAAFGGNSGGGLPGIADPLIVVPSTVTARIQELHILLGHVLCAEIEERLGII
jgi:D-sedoheptulose 7-phosphate isomerase